MTLKEYVLSVFKCSFSGKEHPIKIIDLCLTVNDGEPDPEFWDHPERKVRESYEGLAVCSSPKGLYLLKTETERNEQIALRMKLIYAHFRKIKVLREYKIESDSVQKNLF